MATKSKKDGGQRYDWNLIMNDYVSSDISLRKIAEKYGVSRNIVEKRSKADNWVAARQEFRNQVKAEVRAELRAEKVDNLKKLYKIASITTDAILDAIENDPAYFYKHIITKEMSEKREDLDILNFKDMKDMMRVVKDAEDITRSVLGVPRIEVTQKHELESRKVANEEAKFEWEKQKSAAFRPAEGNAIRIDGFEEGWSE